jgi:hypothetical protein
MIAACAPNIRKLVRYIGYAQIVDCFEKALLAENGNQLPEKLQAKLAEIAKLAAPRQRERE